MPLNNPTDLASPAAIGSITPNSVFATILNVSSSAASTSTTTGAIVTPGGGGFGGSLFLGGGVNAINAALRSGSFTSTIVPAALSANQTINTPNQSGTIALLTDITAATGVQKLFVNNVASAVTGTLVETTLATFTIPANTLGANSCLDIELLLQTSVTNNAKTFRVKIGSDIVFSVNVQNVSAAVHRRTLRNQNSTSSQVVFSSTTISTGNGPISTFAIDFTQTQTVTITAQLALASDTATLRGATFLLY